MHDPREPHLALLKHVLRYIKGTLDYGLQLLRSSNHDLVAYSDADWAGCLNTRRSTSGYAVFMGDNLISWSSKRQQIVSRYSAEAKYHVVANVVAEVTWLRQLLQELHFCPRRSVWYFVIMSMLFISQLIRYSISVPSMLKSTCILFGTK